MTSASVSALEAAALDSYRPIGDVVRLALLVAERHDARDLKDWSERELNGYPDGSELPEYRILHGHVVARDRATHEQAAVGWSSEVLETIQAVRLSQPIAALNGYATASASSYIPFPRELQHFLFSEMDFGPHVSGTELDARMQLTWQVSRPQLAGVLDGVRTHALRLSSALRARLGTSGTGAMEPPNAPAPSTTAQPGPMVVIQSMSGSQLQVGTQGSTIHLTGNTLTLGEVKSFVRNLRRDLPDLELSPSAAAEVAADLTTVEAQLTSPTPKVPVIKAILESVQRVLERAAGGVLANQYGQQLVQLLS